MSKDLVILHKYFCYVMDAFLKTAFVVNCRIADSKIKFWNFDKHSALQLTDE